MDAQEAIRCLQQAFESEWDRLHPEPESDGKSELQDAALKPSSRAPGPMCRSSPGFRAFEWWPPGGGFVMVIVDSSTMRAVAHRLKVSLDASSRGYAEFDLYDRDEVLECARFLVEGVEGEWPA